MTRIPTGKTWMSRRTMTRRRLLSGLSAAATATALAGCLGEEDGDGTGTADGTGDTDDGETDVNSTDDGSDSDESSDDESATVPDSFEDPDELRGYSREFIEFVATGETETALEWFDPEVAGRLTAGQLENTWQSVVGVQQVPDSYRSVAYLGTEVGNNVFTIWATVDDDQFQFTLTFSPEGVIGFQITPIGGWTPPEYVREDAITEEPVALGTSLDCELAGEITLPAGEDGPVPGVVLVHGNGPQDRDGTVGPNRPFKELAWGLASNGIAVLRYDKRTFACEVDLANATIDDIVTDDALTAVQRLRDHDRVAGDRVFVAGHSFGGLLAPRIADREGDLAGTVMLAPGPARSFADTIVDQMEHILDIRGVVGPQREETLAEVRAEAEKIRNLDIDDGEVVRFGGREYHETLQAYDHEATAAELDAPQLLLQGRNDWQITVEDDLPVWEDAMGDRENVTITVYDDLNHLFQKSERPLTQAEYAEPNSPVDARVIEEISSFVRETTGETDRAVDRPLLFG